MTPRALGHGSESPGSPGRHRGHSDPNRVARETCRHSRPSGTGPNSPGPLVDPRVLRKLALVAWGLLVHPSGPWTRARVTRDNWSTPRPLGPEPESPWRVGRPRVAWTKRESPEAGVRPRSTTGTVQSHPGKLVDTTGRRAWAQVTRDCWSTPRALGRGPESRRIVGRTRRPSDLSPSCPGHLVDYVGPQTWAGVARNTWSTQWALGPGPEAPGTDGQHHGPSGTGPSRPGQLVDPAGHQAWARGSRDS